MATFNQNNFHYSFQNWIAQQHQDLEELLNALSRNSEAKVEELKLLGEKGVKHFEEHSERQTVMAQQDATSFISPTWCTSFEDAFLWIGGCRPSLSIRLVYSVSGSELNALLTDFLQGERKGNLAKISAQQLDMINNLHCETIKEEDKMSSRLEEIADKPIATMAKRAAQVGEWSQELGCAMYAHSLLLPGILVDTDRLSTVKDFMGILTPLQGVDLLVATKKLHLSMHEWARRRSAQLGSTTS